MHLLALYPLVLFVPTLRTQAPTPILPVESGAWISDAELAELPTSGSAWSRLRSDADRSLAMNLGDQDDKGDSYAFAAALVYRRLALAGSASAEGYRARVQAALLDAMGTEHPGDGSSLPPSRNVCAAVLAADLIEWSPPSAEDDFRAWARFVLTEEYGDGRSIVSTHEDRPNNWGTHAGASRAAIAAYLGDQAELARCARVFKGWLGDRASYAGFDWGDLSWQADPSRPVGVNPISARKLGVPLGGVLPDDQRRCGDFPADIGCQSNYAWEAMQGALVQAIVLRRRGYDSWRWGHLALARAAHWLTRWNDQPPEASVNGSDDRWQAYVLRRVYPQFAPEMSLASPAPPGKHVGYTDWTTSGTRWP